MELIRKLRNNAFIVLLSLLAVFVIVLIFSIDTLLPIFYRANKTNKYVFSWTDVLTGKNTTSIKILSPVPDGFKRGEAFDLTAVWPVMIEKVTWRYEDTKTKKLTFNTAGHITHVIEPAKEYNVKLQNNASITIRIGMGTELTIPVYQTKYKTIDSVKSYITVPVEKSAVSKLTVGYPLIIQYTQSGISHDKIITPIRIILAGKI